jgi:glycosyltransferase involved in cell wall biosynthesis
MEGVMLKVLHVGPKNYPPNHGGVEKVVYDLVQGLSRVESHVLVEWSPVTPSPRIHQLPKGLFAQRRFLLNYGKQHAIETIHFHKEPFIPLALLAQLAGFSCILTLHGCAWRIPRWPLHIRALFFLLDCVACALLKHVVFVGKRDRDFFSRLIFWKHLHCIPNGVDTSTPTTSTPRNGWAYLGRISPEKNILNLMVAAETAGIDLDIYGPFDLRDTAFRDTVMDTATRMKHVKIKGPIPFDQVNAVLRRHQVFINVSFSEGMPVSVLEAAAAGLYLVLSDIPQHRLLDMPQCTYLPPHNLNLILPQDTPIEGHQNLYHAKASFGVERMAEAYLTLYHKATP